MNMEYHEEWHYSCSAIHEVPSQAMIREISRLFLTYYFYRYGHYGAATARDDGEGVESFS